MKVAKKIVLAIVWMTIAVCLLPVAPVVQANDSQYNGSGFNIYPIESQDIILEYESLNITQPDLSDMRMPGWEGKAQVDVTFILHNTGKEQTVTIGFPESSSYEGIYFEMNNTIYDFRTTVDGVPIDTILQPLKEINEEFGFDKVHLWRVHFEAGQTRTVRSIYSYKPFESINGDWSVEYILRTGRLWSGTIGRIDVFVKSSAPVSGFKFVPYPDEYSEFHAANWEPNRDIVFGSNGYRDMALNNKGKMDDFWIERVRGLIFEFVDFDNDDFVDFYNQEAKTRRQMIREYIGSLGSKQLAPCTRNEIQTYINGIYATHGRPFQTKKWADFFEAKWWYQVNQNYSDSLLTPADQKALVRLTEYLDTALQPES